MQQKFGHFLLIIFLISACQTSLENQKTSDLVKVFNHSYSNTDQIRSKHIALDLQVDFQNKILKGVARHEIEHVGNSNYFILDTKKLSILKVTVGSGKEKEVDYKLEMNDSILGSPLIIKVDKSDKFVNVYYRTNPSSEALGWLDTAQTMSKKPFLYTQGEAILTRSWIPIQDVPSNKITYDAHISVPKDLLALMSATNPQEKNTTGKYSFKMQQPIAPYLIALAVGDITFKKVSNNTGVYAETPWVNAVKKEMEDMPKMLVAAERLCGKYVWGRYDILVLPYSFPFGGMENPRLTFLNPTVIVGDKSLISVTAHELAHSWSGNLVTNETWEDFWLNEGWTVYIEHRIMESLKGSEYNDILSTIEWHEYLVEKDYYKEQGKDYLLSLKPKLDGKNPDDGMTSVAYGRGAFFFKTIEEKIGRTKMNAFVKKYFEDFRFRTVNTEEFLKYLRNEIKGIDNLMNIDEWVYGSKIPDVRFVPKTDKMDVMQELAEAIAQSKVLTSTIRLKNKNYKIERNNFSTQEWLQLLRTMPRTISLKTMAELDKLIDFNSWNNAEIQTEWFLLAIDVDYQPAFPALETFLSKVGRRKFLEPLYVRLTKTPQNKAFAKTVFDKYKTAYHSVSAETVSEILK